MERILIRVLIITSSYSFSAKHVFIQNSLPWSAARRYCREHHTDLTPITNELEEKLFVESVGEGESGWLGFSCNSTNLKWRWSQVVSIQDDSSMSGYCAALFWENKVWKWRNALNTNSFFCLNLVVVQEEKTWEEALDHCRQTSTSLTSLLSESENLLAQTQIQHGKDTQRVWIGLRFLEDRWMWVNGDPLEYQAWNQTGGQCPVWRRCGALTKEGAWEDRDCRERLSFICT